MAVASYVMDRYEGGIEDVDKDVEFTATFTIISICFLGVHRSDRLKTPLWRQVYC